MKNRKAVLLTTGLACILVLAIAGFMQPDLIPVLTWSMLGVSVVTLIMLVLINRSAENHK